MDYEDVREYYSRDEVAREIAEFSKDRWVAVEGESSAEKRLFLRYWDGQRTRPLTIKAPETVGIALKRFAWAKPRAFYGSANLYSELKDAAILEDPQKLTGSTPTWDIDGEPEKFRDTLQVARVIVDDLRSLGITESVYILWSGRGAHVRVHEGAFSPSLKSKHNPLDASYTLVEYVMRRTSGKLEKILADKPHLKVENLMDLKRVFTAPLSLHRQLDLCTVCLKPDAMNDFDLKWANPNSPRHDIDWKKFVEGEADEAAKIALKVVPGYLKMVGSIKTVVTKAPKEKTGEKRPKGKVGRFQIMALLQAARYFVLFGDVGKAKSFGLNRAIFYAWAKRTGGGVQRRPSAPAPGDRLQKPAPEARNVLTVGDEMAFLSKDGWFEIGGQTQTPNDFDRQVVQRIQPSVPYNEAWEKALDYVKNFDKKTLESQRGFFDTVYKPIRDSFLS